MSQTGNFRLTVAQITLAYISKSVLCIFSNWAGWRTQYLDKNYLSEISKTNLLLGQMGRICSKDSFKLCCIIGHKIILHEISKTSFFGSECFDLLESTAPLVSQNSVTDICINISRRAISRVIWNYLEGRSLPLILEK